MAKDQTHLKIEKHNGGVHILPDNRHNREFHERYTKFAPAGDKYKLIQVVSGHFVVDKSTGGQEFEETEVLETIYSNLSSADGKVAAAEAQNETLKEQIRILQEQLAAKGKPGRKKKTEDAEDDGVDEE